MLQWLRQNVRGHVLGWGDSWQPMGKPSVKWGPWASSERRVEAKVKGGGLPQVTAQLLWSEGASRRICKKRECKSCICGVKTKMRHWDVRHTANILLEFMQKSNNTNRNEMRQPKKVSVTQRSLHYRHLFNWSSDIQRNTLFPLQYSTDITLNSGKRLLRIELRVTDSSLHWNKPSGIQSFKQESQHMTRGFTHTHTLNTKTKKENQEGVFTFNVQCFVKSKLSLISRVRSVHIGTGLRGSKKVPSRK